MKINGKVFTVGASDGDLEDCHVRRDGRGWIARAGDSRCYGHTAESAARAALGEEARRLYESGMTFTEVAEALGSSTTTVRRWFRSVGGVSRLAPPGSGWTTQKARELAEARWRSGDTQREAGKRVGISHNTVSRGESSDESKHGFTAVAVAALEELLDFYRDAPEAEPRAPIAVASSPLDTIEFMGVAIPVDTERELVVLKPLCEALGIDWNGQRQRLNRSGWAKECVIPFYSGAAGKPEATALPRKQVPMWIATIDASRLRNDEAREWVEAFQRECVDVLDAHWNRGKGSADAPAPVAASGTEIAIVGMFEKMLERSDARFTAMLSRLDGFEVGTHQLALVSDENTQAIQAVDKRVEAVEDKIVDFASYLPPKRAPGEMFLSDVAREAAVFSSSGLPHWQVVRALLDRAGVLAEWTAKRLTLDDNGKEVTRRVVLAEYARDAIDMVWDACDGQAKLALGGKTYTFQRRRGVK